MEEHFEDLKKHSLTPDEQIDAYVRGKDFGREQCIDAASKMVLELREAIKAEQELPFESPECVLEGMALVLTELQGMMKDDS